MRRSHLGIVCLMLVGAQAAGDAHFKLLEPASWLVASDRGDPQKAAPCGGDNKDKGTPSNIVGKAVGGQKVHIRVLETVYHPGHYRVALAVNSRDELPPDPVTTTRETEKGPRSIWAVIQSPPQKPVLADGLFPHYTKPSGPRPGRPTSSCRTSAARSARCRSCSGWPSTATTTLAATPTITAPIWRSRRIPRSRSTMGWGATATKAN